MARKTSFYYSFLVLPPAQRHAIIAVWDFCRAVDDAVDEPQQGTGAEAVQFWRAELARCYDGTAPHTEQGRRPQPFIAALYLPLEDLRAAGCTVDDLVRGEVTAPVRRLLEFECRRAHEFYAKASAQMPREDRRRLVAAEIMRAVYFETLTRIERRGYDVFASRTRVARPRQALIAFKQWLWT